MLRLLLAEQLDGGQTVRVPNQWVTVNSVRSAAVVFAIACAQIGGFHFIEIGLHLDVVAVDDAIGGRRALY